MTQAGSPSAQGPGTRSMFGSGAVELTPYKPKGTAGPSGVRTHLVPGDGPCRDGVHGILDTPCLRLGQEP